jgi:hypothetical protein
MDYIRRCVLLRRHCVAGHSDNGVYMLVPYRVEKHTEVVLCTTVADQGAAAVNSCNHVM